MTAPSTTVRQTPAGTHLEDGHSTKIACSSDPDLAIWEVSIKPSSLDGGDAIDQTTMWNTVWMTKAFQQLVDAGDVTGSAAYDPKVLDEFLAIVNVNTSWTIKFSNNDTWDWWGALRIFDPQELVKGSQPRANFTITPSNRDTAGVEAGINYKTSVGTD